MRIFNRYILDAVLRPTLGVLFLLVGLRTLFLLIEELGDVGKGSYTALTALAYVLLYMPQAVIELLPMATLIGTVLGLGVLSSNSELTAMRAAAVSPLRIGWATLRAAALLIFASALVGEVVAPATTAYAQRLRTEATVPDKYWQSGNGVWVRSTRDYVRLRFVFDDGSAEQVSIFTFSAPLKLSEVRHAARAVHQGNGEWILYNGTHSRFDGEKVSSETFETQRWFGELPVANLKTLNDELDGMSSFSLWSVGRYLSSNGLDARRYDLEFWRKVFSPLNVFAMVLAAIASVFGPLRTVTVSARILTGIVVGLLFHFSSQIFGPISLVYKMPPVLGALLPPLVFLVAAILLLRRAR